MHGSADNSLPKASIEQIQMAIAMIKKLDLKDYSYANYSNPGKFKIFFMNTTKTSTL